MNRDRGTIKWNAMMLPEHVKLLREWKAEDDYVQVPEIDEWAQEEIAGQLQIATQSNAYIELTYWQDGKIKKEGGYVQRLEQEQVIFQSRYIPFNHLIRLIILTEE